MKINSLIDAISELEEVKKYKKLEQLVDNNIIYKEKLNELFSYQKQMVNSKHLGLDQNYIEYSIKYEKLKKELEEDVVVSLFLDSLEEVNNLLENITSIISNTINEKTNI